MDKQPPWGDSFVVDDIPGGEIRLRQIGIKDFALDSIIRYAGSQTGLEGAVADEVIENIRVVDPSTLPRTDLASVPMPLRWFVAQYGAHTPAALIHDRLIDSNMPIQGLTDAHSDRYFRFMLQDVGVRWIRRWLMWAAVALRTRYRAGGIKQVSVIVWVLASFGGMSLFVGALLNENWQLLALALMAPFAFAALWDRQYGAGVVAAMAAPWVLPPTLFGAIGFVLYAVLEWVAGRFVDRETEPAEPLRYRSF